MMANAALNVASWLMHLNSPFATAASMIFFFIATTALSGEVKMCSASSQIDSYPCLPNSSTARLFGAQIAARSCMTEAR